MARKNRVSVYDGVYHVTSRIANRAMLLQPDEVKEKLMGEIVSIAAFSGVEVWGFTIMDNHLHLIVHVPPVPEKYWLDPNDEPAAYAFGMRPPESRTPLWANTPDGDCPHRPSPAYRIPLWANTPDGDCPHRPSHRPSEGDCPHRPQVGFMLSDDEMLERLSHLYGERRAGEIAEEWRSLREHGCGHLVDIRKAGYCRRMYNLSQYLKTLKERVSMWYNETYKHEGTLWQGRFYSGVVDRQHKVLAIVAAYVAYNPVKARIASTPSEWKWSSFALAVNDAGANGERCRVMYERMFGVSWEDVRETLESIYADELPPGVSPADLKRRFDDYDEDATETSGESERPQQTFRASQAIRVSMKVFRTGAYITEDFGFLKKIGDFLPKKFPCEGRRSVKRCRAFLWDLPERSAA